MNILEKFEADMIEKNIVTFQNAIMYRGYRIYHNDDSWVNEKWAFVHDSYDGTPDANDHRFGNGYTIEDCIIKINEQIKDNL